MTIEVDFLLAPRGAAGTQVTLDFRVELPCHLGCVRWRGGCRSQAARALHRKYIAQPKAGIEQGEAPDRAEVGGGRGWGRRR